jgi:hypothetical protein
MSPRLLLALTLCLLLAQACHGRANIAEEALEAHGLEQIELQPRVIEGHFTFTASRGDHDCSGSVMVQAHDDADSADVELECLPPAGAHTGALPAGAAADVVGQARRCDGGIAAGCTTLALRYQEGDGLPRDRAKANMLFAQACASHDGAGCFHQAKAIEAAAAAHRADVLPLLVDGCDLGHVDACGEAAQRLYNADEQAQAPTMARMARKGCDGADARACQVLGILLAYGVAVPQDMEQARKRLMQACGGGLETACTLVESL